MKNRSKGADLYDPLNTFGVASAILTTSFMRLAFVACDLNAITAPVAFGLAGRMQSRHLSQVIPRVSNGHGTIRTSPAE